MSSLKEGEDYHCANGDRRILKIINEGHRTMVEWEYLDESRRRNKPGKCSAGRFAELAKEKIDGKEYEGILAFIFSWSSLARGRAVRTLNKPIILNGEKMPLKRVIKKLIQSGYKLHHQRRTLYKGAHLIKPKVLTLTGFRYAEHLTTTKLGAAELQK